MTEAPEQAPLAPYQQPQQSQQQQQQQQQHTVDHATPKSHSTSSNMSSSNLNPSSDSLLLLASVINNNNTSSSSVSTSSPASVDSISSVNTKLLPQRVADLNTTAHGSRYYWADMSCFLNLCLSPIFTNPSSFPFIIIIIILYISLL